MPPFSEVVAYLRGLLMLSAGDARGLQVFDISDIGVIRSFLAFVWCLPAMIVYWIFRRVEYLRDLPGGNDGIVTYVTKLLLLDMMIWIVPTLVLMLLAPILQYRPLLRTMVVARNWFMVPLAYTVYAVIAPLSILTASGNGGHALYGMIALLSVTLLIALVISWRILRTIMGGSALARATILILVVATEYFAAMEIEKLMGIHIA
jgi:hypothetical protein